MHLYQPYFFARLLITRRQSLEHLARALCLVDLVVTPVFVEWMNAFRKKRLLWSFKGESGVRGRPWMKWAGFFWTAPTPGERPVGQKPVVEVGLMWGGTLCKCALLQEVLSSVVTVPKHRNGAERWPKGRPGKRDGERRGFQLSNK